MPRSSFSPRRRTGIILCGTGTAGAYHAGALRAIVEAGIKLDVIAAHGAGVPTALAAAIDGGARVWDPSGPWTDRRLARAYPWRPALRIAFIGLAAACLLLLSPALVLAFAAIVYAASLAAALVNLTGTAAWLVGMYERSIAWLFDPPILPTILPRATVLAFLVIAAVLLVAAVRAMRQEGTQRRAAGAFWWRLVGSPIDASAPGAVFVEALWQLVRGASSEPRPQAAEIGRRYVDLLADNFGQPGFHELLIAVHDIDARRDLIGGALAAPARAGFEAPRTGAPLREAEIVDFTGPQRELLTGFLAGALSLPVATAPADLVFAADGYWRGERHRVCDRPGLGVRLVEELAAIGVEQVILVGPSPPPAVPHALRTRPIDLRARIGELVRSVEAAALSDATAAARLQFGSVFAVRPDHNPVGPFDFGGVFDEGSDRQRTIAELMQQGYADAYHYFIEPVVAAGDRAEAL